jgi:hypothetical protein
MVLAAAGAVGAGIYLSCSWVLQPAEIRDAFRFVRAGFAKD